MVSGTFSTSIDSREGDVADTAGVSVGGDNVRRDEGWRRCFSKRVVLVLESERLEDENIDRIVEDRRDIGSRLAVFLRGDRTCDNDEGNRWRDRDVGWREKPCFEAVNAFDVAVEGWLR